MASVVIIHAAENALPARALADKMRAMGLLPVIETPPGDALRQAIGEAVAVVGLWSPQSAPNEGLLGEAAIAARAGKLINARMQNTPAPSRFISAPTIDLTGWRGENDFPGWLALADAIARRAGVAPPPPPPAPVGAGPGFFTPGPAAPLPQAAPAPRAAPQPVAPPPRLAPEPGPAPHLRVAASQPQSRLGQPPPVYTAMPEDLDRHPRGPNLAVVGIIAFLIVAVLGGGGFFAFTQMQGARAAETAWSELDRTSPAQLREFLASANVGPYREEAQAALDSLELERLNAARATDTIPALESFLAAFPNSRHALEINGRIAELRAAPPGEANVDPVTGLPIDPNAPTPALTPPAPAENAPAAPQAPPPAPTPEPPVFDAPIQLNPPTGPPPGEPFPLQ